MDEQKNPGKIEPWERDLAEIMCGTDMRQQLHRAVGIIREVQADSDGERILPPQEWLEQTRKMDAAELDEFIKPKRVFVEGVRNRYSFPVPASLKDNFVKLFDIGLRHPVAVTSGRLADDPNRRDNRGYPYALSALARPLARLVFDTNKVLGGMKSLTSGQKEDIREAAKQSGWCIDSTDGKYLTLQLPATRSGLTADEVAKLATDKLNITSPGWREQPGWQHRYIEAVKNGIREQGGHILYTDRDIADAWNRLTQAIVQKTRQRWERENPRITDIQINRQVDTSRQTVHHTIRCRIDGAQQMSVPLHPLDGGRYDTAVHVGDTQKLDALKRELATTYFSDELQMQRTENHTLKR